MNNLEMSGSMLRKRYNKRRSFNENFHQSFNFRSTKFLKTVAISTAFFASSIEHSIKSPGYLTSTAYPERSSAKSDSS